MHAGDIFGLNHWFGQKSRYRKRPGHWEKYIDQTSRGERIAIVAEIGGQVVGFSTLKLKPNYWYFKQNRIPEINDMIVAPPWRSRGVGKKLMLHLEQAARKKGYKQIGIGVGLYAAYGPAQRLYVKLGYVPDGHGAVYKDVAAKPGERYRLDDDLILYFVKPL